MTFMNQHGDYRAQIDFQISRIELFSAPQIDETAFIQKAVCQSVSRTLSRQTDMEASKDRRQWTASSFSAPDIVAYRFTSQSSFQSTRLFSRGVQLIRFFLS